MHPLDSFSPIQLRWSDFDPNFHLRHSVYYDFGAMARVEFLSRCGLTVEMMQTHHLGPVLFREEAVFRKEVRPGDTIYINLLITKLRPDFSRFSFRHEIVKADQTLCAVMNLDGAWIDTRMRKLTVPPPIAVEMLEQLPKSEDFTWG